MNDVQLIHGDCLAILPTLESGSIDAIVTDPPWMDYATGWYNAGDHHHSVGYLAPETYASEFYRVLRDDSACVLWCRWDCFEVHAVALAAANFRVRNCIVWDKGVHTAGDLDGNLGFQHEMAVFATKGAWKRHGNRETNAWTIPGLFSKAKRDHPTQKPVTLFKRAIELACPRDQIMLDPFAGSGSSLVAAMKAGRKAIGIEIDAKYIPLAQRRIDETRTPLFTEGLRLALIAKTQPATSPQP